MRKINFTTHEHYHVYNRGVDGRAIFPTPQDIKRFYQSLIEFNTLLPIGSIYENTFRRDKHPHDTLALPKDRLVNFICYCLNPNHFHLILEQVGEKGIEKFMHRLGVGYSKYFNQKYKRVGSLFQGTFKAIHIDSNKYLLHLSAYINLNNKVHQFGNLVSKSSWEEYTRRTSQTGKTPGGICEKGLILDQFGTQGEYKEFAISSLKSIKERKETMREFLLEDVAH